MNPPLIRPCVITALLTALMAAPAWAAEAPPLQPLQSLPELKVPPYMGRWYQVALIPNSFQRQCVGDTTAEYRLLPDGTVEVGNRCRLADGRTDVAIGQARPTGRLLGDRLVPARLEVSFLPAWLRWLPVGWGSYWVIQLANDGRYAVVGEPTRQYLWVLSRTPQLATADETAIRSKLAEQGYDLQRLQPHPQSAAAR